ncbi:MAG: hypothetical protein R2761_22030 [Acidimicrobiales bacterium]
MMAVGSRVTAVLDFGPNWLAAFWSFAVDDAKLFAWCCSVLGR